MSLSITRHRQTRTDNTSHACATKNAHQCFRRTQFPFRRTAAWLFPPDSASVISSCATCSSSSRHQSRTRAGRRRSLSRRCWMMHPASTSKSPCTCADGGEMRGAPRNEIFGRCGPPHPCTNTQKWASLRTSAWPFLFSDVATYAATTRCYAAGTRRRTCTSGCRSWTRVTWAASAFVAATDSSRCTRTHHTHHTTHTHTHTSLDRLSQVYARTLHVHTHTRTSGRATTGCVPVRAAR